MKRINHKFEFTKHETESGYVFYEAKLTEYHKNVSVVFSAPISVGLFEAFNTQSMEQEDDISFLRCYLVSYGKRSFFNNK